MLAQLSSDAYQGLQLLVGMLVILGSGVASWVGVKVALAEMRARQNNHDKQIDDIERRVTRLEEKYFR